MENVQELLFQIYKLCLEFALQNDGVYAPSVARTLFCAAAGESGRIFG